MGYIYALSWKLLIIGLHLEYFATFLKRLHLKKIATKCSIFLHQLYFFLLGRSMMFDKDKISFGGKKEGVRGGMGERPKMTVIFAKTPIIK